MGLCFKSKFKVCSFMLSSEVELSAHHLLHELIYKLHHSGFFVWLDLHAYFTSFVDELAGTWAKKKVPLPGHEIPRQLPGADAGCSAPHKSSHQLTKLSTILSR